MLLVAYIRWWYGPGWRDSADRILARITSTYYTFSLPILLRTMFAPWKRIVTNPGASLSDRMRAGVDNLVSRAVGFGVRLCALTAAGVIIVGYMAAGGIILMLWPLLPLLGPALIVGGLI